MAVRLNQDQVEFALVWGIGVSILFFLSLVGGGVDHFPIPSSSTVRRRRCVKWTLGIVMSHGILVEMRHGIGTPLTFPQRTAMGACAWSYYRVLRGGSGSGSACPGGGGGVWGFGVGTRRLGDGGLGFGVRGLEFGVWGLGFGVWGVRFGVSGFGSGI